MKKKAELSMIEIEKIHPHQDNPRKNLGDVTELAESIKANGILQNLTVVQNSDDYFTVIIGHRRLVAAKQAGLTAVPCAVVEMSDSEQLSTMLTENIQRADLTAYEQAQGFQMLIDLGNSVSDVVKITGFSDSTVRRRLKLAELDEEAFRKSQGRQVSFKDYEKLNEIKDIKKRNELLEVIGTNNFNNALYYAKKEQQDDEAKKVIEEKLKNIAVKVNSSAEISEENVYIKNYDLDTIDEFIKEIDSNRKYYYCFSDFSTRVYIYAERTAKEISSKQKADEQKALRASRLRKIEEKADEINNCCENLIINFLTSEKAAHKIKVDAECKDIVLKYIFKEIVNTEYALHYDHGFIDDAFSFKYDNNECINFEDCNFEKLILLTAYAIFEFNNNTSYVDIDYTNCKATRRINTKLNEFYHMLCKIGYVMSDEEIQLRDGTHDIFNNNEEEQ